MPIDNTIALQVQQPDAMKTLSNILTTQQQKLDLSKARDTYDANVAETRAKSNVAVQTQDADITSKKEAAKQQEIATEAKQYELTGQQAQKARDIAQGLTQDPDFVNGNGPAMIEKLGQAREMMVESGVRKSIAEAHAARLISLASTQPKAVHQNLLNNIGSGLSAPQQATVINPNGIAVDDNQTSKVVNTNQMAGGVGQPIDGTAVKKQLPVTATSFDNKTNTPVYTDGHNTPAGPALGQEATSLIPVASVKADFESTQEAGKKAAQNIGILQNIKQYAPGAVLGVGQDRRSLMAGLGGLLGIEPDQLAKTKTDLLAKNSAMLALAGGDTDLAKTLADVANPNVHMTEGAIIHAADQVIGQQLLYIAKQQHFTKLINNPAEYTKELAKWNGLADARIMQYPSMSVKDKQEMFNAMLPDERVKFKEGLRFFEKNRYIK